MFAEQRRNRAGGRQQSREVAPDPEVRLAPRRADASRAQHSERQEQIAEVDHRSDNRNQHIRRMQFEGKQNHHGFAEADI